MSNFNERRKHQRVYRNFILSYSLKGNNALIDVSQINNISQGGVSFIATHPFKQGQELIISLQTPLLSQAIVMEGEVLGSIEKVNGMIYDVRVKFHPLSALAEETLKKIETYGLREN